MDDLISRRKALKSTLGLAGLACLNPFETFAAKETGHFKIGACDWSNRTTWRTSEPSRPQIK